MEPPVSNLTDLSDTFCLEGYLSNISTTKAGI